MIYGGLVRDYIINEDIMIDSYELALNERAVFNSLAESIEMIEIIQEGKVKEFFNNIWKKIKKAFEWIKKKIRLIKEKIKQFYYKMKINKLRKKINQAGKVAQDLIYYIDNNKLSTKNSEELDEYINDKLCDSKLNALITKLGPDYIDDSEFNDNDTVNLSNLDPDRWVFYFGDEDIEYSKSYEIQDDKDRDMVNKYYDKQVSDDELYEYFSNKYPNVSPTYVDNGNDEYDDFFESAIIQESKRLISVKEKKNKFAQIFKKKAIKRVVNFMNELTRDNNINFDPYDFISKDQIAKIYSELNSNTMLNDIKQYIDKAMTSNNNIESSTSLINNFYHELALATLVYKSNKFDPSHCIDHKSYMEYTKSIKLEEYMDEVGAKNKKIDKLYLTYDKCVKVMDDLFDACNKIEKIIAKYTNEMNSVTNKFNNGTIQNPNVSVTNIGNMFSALIHCLTCNQRYIYNILVKCEKVIKSYDDLFKPILLPKNQKK